MRVRCARTCRSPFTTASAAPIKPRISAALLNSADADYFLLTLGSAVRIRAWRCKNNAGFLGRKPALKITELLLT